jgi:ankyrin repeat protein
MFTTVFRPVLTVIPLRQADIIYIFISYYILYISYFIYYIYLYTNQLKQTALHSAAARGHDKIVETLVEAKADVCAQDEVSVLKETRLDADRGMR